MKKEKRSRFTSPFKKKRENKQADKTLHKSEPKKSLKKGPKKRKDKVNVLANLSIGTKYLATFSISVIFFLTAIVLVFIQLNHADTNVEDIIEKNQLTNDMAQLALLVEQQNATISDYIIVGNNRSITNFEEITEELKSVFERLEVHFENDEENLYVFNRVKDMNAKIEDIFLNKVAGHSNSGEIVYAQIQIGSQKTASVTSINRLIDSVNEQQDNSVTKVEDSMERSMYILVLASIVSIVSGFIIMVLISRMISRNMKNVVTVTDELAKGNLAVEAIRYKGKDEVGQLANAVNSLRENMNSVIREVINAAKSLDVSSEVMTKSATEVKEGSEQMVTTMEELASGSESQANSASDLSEKMQQFLESVQTSQQEGQEIAVSSKDMLTLTSDGASLMKQSVSQMSRIDNIVSNAVQQVRGLDEQSNQISKLVEVVKDIADQTNLLALNAAIEAARAGEHGRGFAVVADEVRKLAEQVTSSVSEITQIVSDIQTETDDVVDSLGKGYEEVKEGIQQIEKTGHSFNTIDGAISGVVDNISKVANRLKEIAENSEQMNTLIGDIAAVSEEAAAGIEQSSASTQEASSSMDEISNNAQELANLSNKLNKEVSIFKLK